MRKHGQAYLLYLIKYIVIVVGTVNTVENKSVAGPNGLSTCGKLVC